MGGEYVITLPAETWQAIRDRAEQLLTIAEVEGLSGAVFWLTQHRLPGRGRRQHREEVHAASPR
jgi:hypothetical protein